MRFAIRLLGHGLTAAGLIGMLLAGALYVREQTAQERALEAQLLLEEGRALDFEPRVIEPVAPPDTSAAAAAESHSMAPDSQEEPEAGGLPITRVRLGRIGLDSDVVQAKLVQVAGGLTWEVPAFRVGHGEHSAGAGEQGNAVLLGHVTSLNAGNVFRDLNRARPGDEVWLAAGEREYRYVVVEVRSVNRTDVSVLGPRPDRSVSLITCTGAWLPALNDFAERLVVRAELAEWAGLAAPSEPASA